jgi:hypothetical protein
MTSSKQDMGDSSAEILHEITTQLSRYVSTFLPYTSQYNSLSEEGVARKVLCGIAVALDGAASAIEAQRAATENTGAVADESAVPPQAGDAQ